MVRVVTPALGRMCAQMESVCLFVLLIFRTFVGADVSTHVSIICTVVGVDKPVRLGRRAKRVSVLSHNVLSVVQVR